MAIASAQRAETMTSLPTIDLGARWHKRLAADLADLGKELSCAVTGDDRGVHRARKAIQRVRGWLRLIRPLDPVRLKRLDTRWKRLRRRMGRLRDAAVRLELVQAQLRKHEDADSKAALQAAEVVLLASLAALWKRHDEAFWIHLMQQFERLRRATLKISASGLTPGDLADTVDRARDRARRELKSALGHDQRTCRHEARRLLRRYAVMRVEASQLVRRQDRYAKELQELARKLGVEGDLWLTRSALRHAAGQKAGHGLRRELEKERRKRCRAHDGAVAAALIRLRTRHKTASMMPR